MADICTDGGKRQACSKTVCLLALSVFLRTPHVRSKNLALKLEVVLKLRSVNSVCFRVAGFKAS